MTPAPRVALAACADYEPAALDAALESTTLLLGGIESLVSAGLETVVLKPNFLSARAVDRAVTTHPQFIAAAARLVRRVHRGRLLLADSPGFGSGLGVARKLGLPELLSALEVEFVELTERVPVAGGGGFGPIGLARPLVEADAIVNLVKVKTHGLMYFTGAVKNMFGAVVGMDKPRLHLTAGRDTALFARYLLEVAARVPPALSLADGVIGMEGNGPSAGRPRRLGLVAAAIDPVALDRVLVEALGFEPWAVPVLAEAAKAGAPGADLAAIEIAGEPLGRFRVTDWQPARPAEAAKGPLPNWLARPLREALATRPVIDHARCTRCGRCAATCAAGALSTAARGRRPGGPAGSDRAMAIDLTACIRCYCCQEICPEDAIRVGAGWLGGLLAARRGR